MTRVAVAGATIVAALGIAVLPASADSPLALRDARVADGDLTVVVTGTDGATDATVRIGDKDTTSEVTELAPATDAVTDRSVVLVLDTSISMTERGLARSRAAVLAFAAEAPRSLRIGLVGFSQQARELVAPTLDRVALRRAVADLELSKGTSLYDAVAIALNGERRHVLVLSDGADTASEVSLRALISTERTSKSIVDVLTIGALPDANSAVQQAIAIAGHGTTYDVGSAAAATGVFSHVARGAGSELLISAHVPAGLYGPTDVDVTVDGRTTSMTVTLPESTFGKSGGSVALYAALGGCFLALVLLVFFAFDYPMRSRSRRQLRELVANYTSVRSQPPNSGSGDDALRTKITRSALAITSRVASWRSVGSSIGRRLERAAVPLQPNEWLLICAAIAIVVTVLVTLLSGQVWAGALVGIVAGVVGPHAYLKFKASRRRTAFLNDLPDALALVSSSLTSGYSLPQALDSVVRLGEGPTAEEFGRALVQARLGTPVEDALDEAAARVDCQDLHWAVMAIRIQHQVGGNLSEVLGQVAETIRERGRLARHVRGLTAEGRLSAWVLGCLPVFLGGFMFLTRRDYIRPLYTERLGFMMLAGGVTLLLAGALWMRQLIKIEL